MLCYLRAYGRRKLEGGKEEREGVGRLERDRGWQIGTRESRELGMIISASID